jgi:hypothetical protein
MRSLILLGMLMSCATGARADSPQKELCFDFKTKVTKPLRVPPPFSKESGDVFSMGVRNKDVQWAAARGLVNLPLKRIYYWLLDHKNWKDMSKTKLQMEILDRPNYLAFHRVDVDVNVWAFIWVSWQEEWAYAMVKGVANKPTEMNVSYQIPSGTPHIRRLCGSVYLTQKDPDTTDVFFYEESRADNYSANDIKTMHESNFKVLRNLKVIPR